MADTVKYPIGEQDFKSLIEMGCLYVDKTQYIEKIISSGHKYYFLARPRRFGKSLFLSSLQYFFKGRRELFKGLYIDSTDWDWKPYPVLRLDLNTEKYEVPGLLDSLLDNTFKKWEKEYGIQETAETLSTRFQNIIATAHEKTGRQVVILVDEYDKPLVGNLNVDETFEHYQAKLASVYSNFKSSAEHIRLVFLTGVSRFSKLSIFSDLNNIRDITFVNEFSDICGITEKELLDNFKEGIRAFAEENEISYEETYGLLKKNYDGYRFAKTGSDIYNPWSVLNAMQDRSISNYWGRSGKATIIAEALKNVDADLEGILTSIVSMYTLEGLDLKSANPVALLYQTGYITIKDYDFETDYVTLGVPNLEVRQSLFDDLLPYYVKTRRGTADLVVQNIIMDLRTGKPEKFVKDLDIFLAGIPYEMKMDDENNLHNALFILLTLLGVAVETEVHTSDGRIDLVVKTPKFIYIIELKFDKSAEEAMTQIEQKQYSLPYANDPRRLFKLGLNFSSTTRHLDTPRICTATS
ncbi:MAG: ATP-binding protein [Muribaculaceae bacterium]|nr:ATP-binding protein [Muribaculaceae bacterium]